MKKAVFTAILIVLFSVSVSVLGVIAGFYMFGLTDAVVLCGIFFLLIFLMSMVWIAALYSKKSVEEAEKQTKLLKEIAEKLGK